mgnify:CR=1 FL=1
MLFLSRLVTRFFQRTPLWKQLLIVSILSTLICTKTVISHYTNIRRHRAAAGVPVSFLRTVRRSLIASYTSLFDFVSTFQLIVTDPQVVLRVLQYQYQSIQGLERDVSYEKFQFGRGLGGGHRSRQCLDILDNHLACGGKEQDASVVILFVHGGAWGFGDKNIYTSMLLDLQRELELRFNEKRIIVAACNYRLYPMADMLVMVEDVAAAVRLLHYRYGCQISLVGHSAGSHLAISLLCYESMCHEQNAKLSLQSLIKGYILQSGVYDIGLHYAHETSRGVQEYSPMKPAALGMKRFSHVSPVNHVKPVGSPQLPPSSEEKSDEDVEDTSSIPIRLLHSDEDLVVPSAQSKEMLNCLQSAGYKNVKLTHLQGGHDLPVMCFLDPHFGGEKVEGAVRGMMKKRERDARRTKEQLISAIEDVYEGG